MKKPLKILLGTIAIIVLLVCIAPVAFYYITGINYFAIGKTFTKSEIEESAKTYSGQGVFLIKPDFLKEYGQGRFPKYKIYTPMAVMLNIHPCYESLPTLPVIINQCKNRIDLSQKFESEIEKIREMNNDSTWQNTIFKEGRYNMIFYYKNAMNRIQKKQLSNILSGNLGDFKDSLNVIFVNVDAVDF